MLVTIIFLLFIGTLVFVSVIRGKSVYNLYTLLAGPYVILVFLNQFIAQKYFGFYKISDEVILMLLGALIAFFIGSYPFTEIALRSNKIESSEKFSLYNMKLLSNSVLICGSICAIWSMYVLSNNGVSVERFDESGQVLSGGIVAHLKLLVLSITPIVALYGIKSRNLKALIGTSLVLFSVFLSFTKYDIICAVTSIAIFIGYNETDYAKKSLIAFIAFPIILFFLNYLIGFFLRGINVSKSFYSSQLWTYLGGSVIYDNYIFSSGGIRVGTSLIEKIMIFVFALPNMFLGRLFGHRYFEHIKQAFLPISYMGDYSNVTDAIGYIYPSHGDSIEVLNFILFMVFIGALFSLITNFIIKNTEDRFSTVLPYFLSEFVLMSFFGTFYVNPGPWEQLVYCAIIPNMFIDRTKIMK